MYVIENKIILFCMILQVMMSLIFIFMQNIGYAKMLNMSENIRNTDDNEIINIRKNRKIVYNVDIYVDNYVNKFIFCGLKLYTISNICGYLINFLFTTWSFVVIYGIYLQCDIDDLLWIIMLGILIIGGLFSLGWSVDKRRLEYIAKVNIRYYMEDILGANKIKNKTVMTRKEIAKDVINKIEEKTVVDFN